MNSFHLRLLQAAGAIALTLCSAHAGPLQETLARIDRAAAGFKGIKAELVHVHHTAVINDNDEESGTFLMKRARSNDIRVLFDIMKPEPKQYAFDGHEVEQYLPRAQTLQIYEAGKYKSLVEELLVLGFGTTSKELLAHYNVSLGGPEAIGNEKATRLELVPKSPDQAVRLMKVDLWISDTQGVPVQQKFYSAGGDYNLFTYSNLMINPNIADSAVKPNVPKGIKREYPLK